jgi:hypothetical protein
MFKLKKGQMSRKSHLSQPGFITFYSDFFICIGHFIQARGQTENTVFAAATIAGVYTYILLYSI